MKLKLITLLMLALASVPAVAGTVYQLPQVYVQVPGPIVPSPYHFDKVQVFGLNTLGYPADVQVADDGFVSFSGWTIANTGLGWSQLSGPETSFATFNAMLDIPTFPGYLDIYLIRGTSIQFSERIMYGSLPTPENPLGFVDMSIDPIPDWTYELDTHTGSMDIIDPPAMATPEPSSIALLASGGLVLLLGRQKQKHKS